MLMSSRRCQRKRGEGAKGVGGLNLYQRVRKRNTKPQQESREILEKSTLRRKGGRENVLT